MVKRNLHTTKIDSISVYERYVTIKDVASHLNVSIGTIYHWTHMEYIPHYKLRGQIRFKISEIENWMKQRRVKGRNQYRLSIIT